MDALTQPQWPAFERFAVAAKQNSPDELRRLAQEWSSSADPRENHLALLAHGAATFRSDDHPNALKELESLLSTVPSTEFQIHATARRILSRCFIAIGDLNRGLQESDIGLKGLPPGNYAVERIGLMNTRAEALLFMGEFEQAYFAFAKNADYADSLKLPSDRGGAENGMGLIRLNQARYPEAESHFREALAMARLADAEMLMQNVVANISTTAAMDGRHDMAIGLCDSLIHVLGTRSPEFKASLYNEKGFIHRNTQEHVKAMDDFSNALALLAPLGESRTSVKTHQNLAAEYWDIDRPEDAFTTMNKVLLSAERMHWTELQAEVHMDLHKWNAALGRDKEAIKHLQLHVAFADSVSKRRYDVALAGAEALHGVEKKELQIIEQQQALELSKEEALRRAFQRNVMIGATLVLVLLVLLMYKLIRDRRKLEKQEKELHDEQVDQLLSQQEIKSINSMLEGQENERDRMSKDLHDRLGSMLGGIKANMAALEDRVEQVQKDLQFVKVNRLLDQAVGEIRQISHDMAAATLSRFGLEKALKDLRDTIHINGRLSVELNVFGLDQRLERSVELAVYRMVQELVSNVLKHADARELSIAVTRTPGRLSVVVSDDGNGFDTSIPAEGMGLSNVRSRAAALGATVQVDSTPGQGTTVSVECPVVE